LAALGLALLGLAACSVPQPRIAEAIDPMTAAPPDRATRWQPTSVKFTPNPSPTPRPVSPRPPTAASVDNSKVYGLADLVDLGLRSHPSTRATWEETRAAAARLGIAESAWLPALTARTVVQYERYPFPGPEFAYSIRGHQIAPSVALAWTLFDPARPARIDQAMEQLFAANFAFNRNHQKVAYDVQKALFALASAEARVAASEVTLRQTGKSAEQARSLMERGLATEPDRLLAVQDEAKAAYDLEAARGEVLNARARLAESLGITPEAPLKTAALAEIALPKDLEESAEKVIDQALEQRPDLSARLAEIRSEEAAVKKAEAAYWPTLSLNADAGFKQWDYRAYSGFHGEPISHGFLTSAVGLWFKWDLFDGLARENEIHRATAARNAAQAQFDTLQLAIIREVWQAYADLKTALRKRDYALAMLAAAEKSYAAAGETYANGLSTIVELLMAERNLATARQTEIDSRTALLQTAAALVYAAGAEAHPEDFDRSRRGAADAAPSSLP
jgi:outer membrane protein TolC